MTTPLDEILSRDSGAVPAQETNVADVRSEPEGETQQEQIQTSNASSEQAEAAAEAERERRRGSGGQLDAAKDRHRQELEQATERVRKEEAERWRRTLAAEVRRAEQDAFQRAQQQHTPPPPIEEEIFNNPTSAIQRAVSPQFEQANQKALYNDRLIAEGRFGDSAVAEAEAAFISALQNGQIDPNGSQYHQVVASPNRYAASVQWHKEYKRSQLLSDQRVSSVLDKFGTDPSLIEKFETFISSNQQVPAEQQQQQQQPAPVMPSNLATVRSVGARNGPAWGGPAPINDIFARKRSG